MVVLRHGGNLAWAAAQAGCSPECILDFSASISPWGCPAGVQAFLADPSTMAALHHYPDPSYRALREVIGTFHGIDPDWILPGNGVAELLTWAGRDLAAGGPVGIVVPAFADYMRALRLWGGVISPLSYHCLNFHSCSSLLLNNPHNPTGYLYPRSDMLPLLEKQSLVVIDEAFMDFLPPEHSQSVLDWVPQYSNLVVLRSLTKFYALPGLRLGYAVGHPDRLQRWHSWRDPWSVNALAAQAASFCLRDRDFQERIWAWLPTARQHLYRGLASIPGLLPQKGAANFLLVETDRSAVALRDYLLQKDRILIRDCVSFPELGERFFRVCVRTEAENDRLLEALTTYYT